MIYFYDLCVQRRSERTSTTSIKSVPDSLDTETLIAKRSRCNESKTDDSGTVNVATSNISLVILQLLLTLLD